MTTVQFTVDDGRFESIERILKEIPFVHDIEVINAENKLNPTTQYERLKKILDGVKDKDLFKEIEDPAAWQREIRKEWERDF